MEQFNTANENLYVVQNEEISKYMLDGTFIYNIS